MNGKTKAKILGAVIGTLIFTSGVLAFAGAVKVFERG